MSEEIQKRYKINESLKKVVNDVLNTDPLAVAEEITGESYKESKATASLGLLFHMENAKQRKDLMEAMGDVCFSESVDSYLNKIMKFGFKIVLETPFITHDDHNNGNHEKQYILFHYDYSILLVFDTYGGKSVNGGNFYFNWSPNDFCNYSSLHHMSGGFASHASHGESRRTYTHIWNRWTNENDIIVSDFSPHKIPQYLLDGEPEWNDFSDDGYKTWKILDREWNEKVMSYIKEHNLGSVYVGHKDCREAVLFSITDMVENGIFLKKWVDRGFIWLCHHGETTGQYDSKSIFKERFAQLPKDVQDAMTPTIFV